MKVEVKVNKADKICPVTIRLNPLQDAQSMYLTMDEAREVFTQLARVDGILPDAQEVGAEYRRMLNAPNSVIPNYFDGAQFIVNKIKGL